MANQIMRITLKAYDHKLIDKAAAQIVDTVKKTGAKVSGPVPMPTKIEKISIRTQESSLSRELIRDLSMLWHQVRRLLMHYRRSICQLVYSSM